MTAKVEFFFDVVSSYSYMAATQIDQIRARTGAEVVYRPMFLGGLMKTVGNAPPATVALKGQWLYKDLHRWAEHYDVPFVFSPMFPLNTIPAQRAMTVVLNSDAAAGEKFVRRLFDVMWTEKGDPNSEASIRSAAEAAGVDAEPVLAGMKDQAIKDQVRKTTDEAAERGAFGAPSFFLGDKLFWGNDRIDHLEREIARANP